jgi:hypothetical protein
VEPQFWQYISDVLPPLSLLGCLEALVERDCDTDSVEGTPDSLPFLSQKQIDLRDVVWVLAVFLRLRPTLILASCVLSSTPPLFQCAKAHSLPSIFSNPLLFAPIFQPILTAPVYTVSGDAVTIKELMDEQRRQVLSTDPAERFAAALLFPAELSRRLRFLTNVRLGVLLEHEVCSNQDFLAPELTVCAEAAERLRRTPWLAGRKHRSNSRMLGGEHLLHAEVSLYRARIPYLLLPFRRDRFASNTFMVSDVAGARVCLLEAGFRTSRSPLLLIDGQTRRLIQLYEDRA